MVKAQGWTPAKCPRDCIYRGSEYGKSGYAGCNYLSATGMLRGCEPGMDCEKYQSRAGKPKPKREAALMAISETQSPQFVRQCNWDNERGYRMWLDGVSVAQIARELGVKECTVQERKRRRWANGKS